MADGEPPPAESETNGAQVLDDRNSTRTTTYRRALGSSDRSSRRKSRSPRAETESQSHFSASWIAGSCLIPDTRPSSFQGSLTLRGRMSGPDVKIRTLPAPAMPPSAREPHPSPLWHTAAQPYTSNNSLTNDRLLYRRRLLLRQDAARCKAALV